MHQEEAWARIVDERERNWREHERQCMEQNDVNAWGPRTPKLLPQKRHYDDDSKTTPEKCAKPSGSSDDESEDSLLELLE